jgi:hypothetical protein
MNKNTPIFISFLFVFTSVCYISCNKEKAGGGIKTSAYNDTSSHDVGTACLSCHNTGGSNAYWWVAAGSVYKPDTSLLAVGSTVYLFTKGNGGSTPVAVLPVDAKGNFYTSTIFGYGSGLYPGVKSSSGNARYMQSSTTNGDCNSCHNKTRRITVN